MAIFISPKSKFDYTIYNHFFILLSLIYAFMLTKVFVTFVDSTLSILTETFVTNGAFILSVNFLFSVSKIVWAFALTLFVIESWWGAYLDGKKVNKFNDLVILILHPILLYILIHIISSKYDSDERIQPLIVFLFHVVIIVVFFFIMYLRKKYKNQKDTREYRKDLSKGILLSYISLLLIVFCFVMKIRTIVPIIMIAGALFFIRKLWQFIKRERAVLSLLNKEDFFHEIIGLVKQSHRNRDYVGILLFENQYCNSELISAIEETLRDSCAIGSILTEDESELIIVFIPQLTHPSDTLNEKEARIKEIEETITKFESLMNQKEVRGKIFFHHDQFVFDAKIDESKKKGDWFKQISSIYDETLVKLKASTN